MRIARSAAALAFALAACSATTPAAGPGPTETPQGSPTPSPSAVEIEATVTVFYSVSGQTGVYLAPERHRVLSTPRMARTALDELMSSDPLDPDHRFVWPARAQVRSLALSAGTATVDWSADVLENPGVGSGAEVVAVQQIVYTLTAFPSIQRVRFLVEGKRTGAASNGSDIGSWWGHGTYTSRPLTRGENELEPVTVWSPDEGAHVRRTFTVTGEASTFEAAVGLRLVDPNGHEAQRTSALASIGAPGRGSWSHVFTIPASSPGGSWILEAFDSSEQDGSVTFRETRALAVN